MKFTLYQELMITVRFKRMQAEMLGKETILKIEELEQISKAQNNNHKDLETPPISSIK